MTVESAADQALALKKRARRRLVGAIALVLLMLIILPNVLKDRAQIEQRTPITLTMPEEVQSESEIAATPESPATEEAIAPSAETTNPPAQAENPTSTPVPPTVSSPVVAPPQETPKNPVVAEEKIVPKPQTPIAQASVVKEQPKSRETKPTRYLIQVGVFSDAENVKKLQAKISEAGFSSRTAKLSTPKGEKIRLRVGTFVTRDAAAEALKKMEAHGLTGMVLMDE